MAGSVNTTESGLVEKVSSNVPKYLILFCPHCLRNRKIEKDSFKREVARSGPLKGKLTVYGVCRRCGKEVRESIDTDEDLKILAIRVTKYFKQQESRKKAQLKKQRKTKKVAKTKKAAKSAEASEKKTSKTKAKAKTTSVKKVAKGSTKKAKASSNGGTRERVYVREEGQPNQQQAFMTFMSGGMWTVEQIQDRHDKLADKGIIGRRTRPISKTDLSFMTGPRVGTVEMPDGSEHEAYRSKNDEGEDVFGVPTLADALKKGAKAGKVAKKGRALKYGGLTLVKKRGDLKD